MFRTALLLLCTISFFANADTSDGKAFQSAALDAAFNCELKSSLVQAATSYGSLREKQYLEELSACLSEKGASLTVELKSIHQSSASQDLRDSAKNVYSAWLTYSRILLGGISSAQQKSLPEGVAFRKALSEYNTELILATP